MGRKLDLSGLTDVEAEHVMQVVQRDMELRKTEEKRLNEMKKALVEEGSRSVLLSRQHRFNERCCILCCSPFTFLLNPKRSCLDCCYNLCKGCCTYSKKDKGWLCSVCQKTRLLKTQSLEWFYYNVRRRFKRFGSAKVLKNLYRRHAAEHGVLAELTATEGSTYEESSMYESDSTFFRQSEEHSMAETINVALRVAEEAIDEAIAKAVSQTDSQEKQNEAHYLLENREELIEELGKTIVKKSPDGNWIAYQSNLLSRPGLLTKRKSLVYSVLERESGVVSAYDEMGSETEQEANGVWGAALEEFQRKMSANKQLSYSESYSRQATLPLNAQAQHFTEHTLNADTEDSAGQDGPLHQSQKTLLPFLKRKVPLEHRRPSSARHPYNMDINFNPGGAESSEDGLEESRVKRSRRRRKNKREEAEWKGQSVLSSAVPDFSNHLSDAPVKRCYVKQDLHGKRPCDHGLEADTSDTATPDILSSGALTPDPFGLGLNAPSNSNHGALGVVGSLDQEFTTKLKELTSQVRETQISSTEDELDRCEYQMGNGESLTKKKVGDVALTIEADSKERSDGIKSTNQVRSTEMVKEDNLTSKLREFTSQVSETLLSSTEDELDRCEYQTETKGINQSIRTEVLEVDDRTDGNKMIQYDEKTQNYVEMVEKAEEERSEKTLAKQGISEQNDTGDTQMSEEISSVSQKQTLDKTDAQTREEMNKGEVQTEEKNAEIKDCGSAVEGQQSRAENTVTVDNIEEQEVLSCELALSRLISEDGNMEFDRIINTVVKALDDMEEHIEAYTSEGVYLDRERSEGEKHEMMEEKENITEQETDDNIISEGWFVGGKSKVVQEKEKKEEGKINEVVALKSNTEDTEETEDKQCSKSSEERVQEKNDNSQGDLIENREEQRDPTIQHSASSGQEEYLSPEEIYKKYSAASLRSITTEVLKVLNATEDLIHGSMGDGRCQSDHSDVSIIPPDEAKRLDEQLGRLEENVYVAAGTVYGLEAELGDLEECARCISGSTSERELAHLEDQVASAAAQVQQSELQVLDISSRIAALKNAGLKLTPQTNSQGQAPKTKTQTIGSSRKLRRRLPAPPKQDKEA
ncbi:hypothetical protein cypCar_00009564 [Cyprinus carpio]|nr:hypothetical protein cypCar_00009564 [Cyprinus carpio]